MELPQLETLEIVCYGDLREIFPLNTRPKEQEIVKDFPRLRRIHLHNLPMLHSICGRMMSAPMLETLIVTGCPALRRMPAVGGRLAQPPTVVCEKDWWDGLEWDGLEANHHPSLFHPRHSRHYRKPKLHRGTVLRSGDRSSNIIIACSHIHSFIPWCSVGIYVTHHSVDQFIIYVAGNQSSATVGRRQSHGGGQTPPLLPVYVAGCIASASNADDSRSNKTYS